MTAKYASRPWAKPMNVKGANEALTKSQYDEAVKGLGHSVNWHPQLAHRRPTTMNAETVLYAGSSAIDAGDGVTL